MSELLEAAMLLCFGLSWPISLIKNIKAKSAKNMSLCFTMLIIVGYIAGITSKIISHRINYVLIVYLFNLAVVSLNLAVYFLNKRHDISANKAHSWNMRWLYTSAVACKGTAAKCVLLQMTGRQTSFGYLHFLEKEAYFKNVLH